MRSVFLAIVFFVGLFGLVACNNSKSEPNQSKAPRNYQVSVRNSGSLVVCQVTFLKKVPANSDDAAAIVRGAVEELVKKDPSREILAMAFDQAGNALAETRYGGALVYKPTDGKILTSDERDGKKVVEVDEGKYFVKLEESRTAKGITPVRRWINLSLVFSTKPDRAEIRGIVEQEIEKLKERGLDINAYLFVGNKDNPGSWNQVQAPNGKYMTVDYTAETGKMVANWNWGS